MTHLCKREQWKLCADTLINGVFHIQNVTTYGCRLKGWIGRFHGITTPYLKNCPDYRRMLVRCEDAITPASAWPLGLPFNN